MYHRRELWLLSLLALALAVGSLVQQFRSGFPELAQRLESVDSEEQAPPPSTPVSSSGRPPGGFTPHPQKLSPGDRPLSGPLNLNQAGIADLQRLPGIGPTLARRIVEAREQRGRFAASDELLTVPGIGTKKFEAIKELVTVDGPNDG